MDFSLLLWLLLPVAALSGWLLAQRHYTKKQSVREYLPYPDYLQGLSYLFDEQHDKAIEVFIRLLEVNNDTVETHLALGVLFRRRGEIDRATRIHQNLMERNNLHPSQHALAMLELAHDYFSAGLLDRAEALFWKLVKNQQYRTIAYRQLLQIYQQEQDWQQAIDTAKAFSRDETIKLDAVIAQYYCELAQQAYQKQAQETALSHIQQALDRDKQCVRASLLEGRIYLEMRQFPAAISALQQVEQQNPRFLSEILQPLQQCFREIEKTEQFIQYLQAILERYAGTDTLHLLAQITLCREGKQATLELIHQHINTTPSLQGVADLIQFALPDAKGHLHDGLLLLQKITHILLEKRPLYHCRECGFSSKTLYWYCPSCQQWNSIYPIQDAEYLYKH
ncbi:lipopolysaccharide assembly protein LapB [Candidatus Venteria ishoeyi]|uniref:Lipopolysaccharide assembly protein B n=1 Tax=Candidatus Venteria ishoeyi TaxID=1899563 RepID=A0A1H6FH96_9GAMM|nr:lipopolysaccharide assembly protein LapB [Candidatus Venteria ishoeyi]SEH08536.1 tetratricopeptide repeat protein [Candidatus Venteria ishoeyi]